MEQKIIISREERLIKFAELYPNEALELISLGEPVSGEFFKQMASVNPDFVDKMFNICFLVRYEFNPYSIGRMETDDTQRIYEFMKHRYGKKTAENMVMEREVLWRNFLPYAAKALSEDGRLKAKFQELVSKQEYDVLYSMFQCLPAKYRLHLQKNVSDDDLVSFVEYSMQTYKIGSCSDVFDVEYLVDKNILTPGIVAIYLANHLRADNAIKKIVRKKNGLEMIEALNDEMLKERAETIRQSLKK